MNVNLAKPTRRHRWATTTYTTHTTHRPDPGPTLGQVADDLDATTTAVDQLGDELGLVRRDVARLQNPIWWVLAVVWAAWATVTATAIVVYGPRDSADAGDVLLVSAIVALIATYMIRRESR